MLRSAALALAGFALAASSAAYADTAVKPALKVAQIKRARAAADPRKAHNVTGLSLPLLVVGVVTVGVGISAAAGLTTTSP